MGDLTPIAFDIETSGLNPGAVVTVAGLALPLGSWLALNTTGRAADADRLEADLEHTTDSNVRVAVYHSEADLLRGLDAFTSEHLNGDRHYLTAFNGETWRGGFDLPFVRSACVRRDVDWPFPDMAFADTMTIVDRFHTGDVGDLVGVYDALVGGEDYDPFEDSGSAVAAYEDGEWLDLLLHNLADIERTRELALLAGRFVAKSDFRMKNLSPPDR
jgi:hypothetical protein